MQDDFFTTLMVIIVVVYTIITWIGFPYLAAENYNIDKDEWICTESILTGKEHNKKSECIQYNIKNKTPLSSTG